MQHPHLAGSGCPEGHGGDRQGRPLILVVDYGTSSCRAALVGSDGELAQSAAVPTLDGVRVPAGIAGGAELDPEAAWRAVVAACGGLRLPAGASMPEAVVVSTVLAYVLLDAEGRALGPSLLWMDRRAAAEARTLARELPDYAAQTGRALSAEMLLPKLLWLRAERPDFFKRIRRIIGLKDWIAQRLTGAASDYSDYAHLNYTGLVAWQNAEPLADLAVAAGLPAGFIETVLPRPRSAATIRGYLSAAAARDLGLPAAVPVVTGSIDGTTAMYGAGVCLPNTAACVSGTTDVLMARLETGLTETGTVRSAAAAGLSLNTGMEPGYGLVGGAMGLSAAALTRFAALTSGTAELDASGLEDAAGVPPGSDGLLALPGLTGERAPYWHQRTGGGLYGLRLDHGRAHVLRAVMEAGAYRLRAVLDRLRSLGISPARLLISGGGAGSAVWNRIRADVCGLPVERARNAEATCLGAAMFARRALNPALSLGTISGEWIGTRDRYEPDPGLEAVYAPARRRFEGLLSALARFEEEA